MSDWNPKQPNVSYTFTTSYDTYPTTYTVFTDGSTFSIVPDLDAIYTKADKEFEAMEDQTSVARQMLNDIGINWNEE
jgi:hypothetical protein|tara:strand:- start:214 stop:444 length:231 start_codon:yes stop_codon:yes gene_type:complete